MIGLSAKGERDATLQPISEAAVRALSRKEAAGFRRSTLDGLQETFVSNSAGLLVPAIFGIADLTRFDRVTARIIKGLFFVERAVPLPIGYRVTTYSVAGLTRLPRATGEKLAANIETVLKSNTKSVGGIQFLYWSAYSDVDPNLSFWVMLIHRHHSFIGWTVKNDVIGTTSLSSTATI